MTENKWTTIAEVNGELQAELIRSLLDSQGIWVFLNQEGAGRAYGLSVGTLGLVQILVPESQSQLAKEILTDYYSGKYEHILPDIPDETGPYEEE